MNNKIKNQRSIAVVGANGKMGREVCRMLSINFSDYKIKRINKNDRLAYSKNLCLVIDFATAESSAVSAAFCAEHGIPLIIGSTGQTITELNKIKTCSHFTPIVKSGNFSLGISFLKDMLKKLSLLPVSDICITEKHHKFKADSPSGTALELENLLSESVDVQPQILSERGGLEIGTHSIDIYFGAEKLSLTHQAFSREAFSSGVKICAHSLLSGLPPKLYTFDEILHFKSENT